MGFTEILTLIFIVLKLTHYIDWSWWYVLLPEIIMGVIYLTFFSAVVFATYKAQKKL